MRTSLVILSLLSSKFPCTQALHVDAFQPQHAVECPENGITMYGKRDGFGATFAAMLGVYVYAAMQNRTYCTTQWTHKSHGVLMYNMFYWVGGSEFGPPATSQTEQVMYCNGWAEYDKYTHEQQQIFNEARDHARDSYFKRTKPIHESLNLFGEISGSSEKVAWHIRRGDVGPRSGERYLSGVDISEALSGLNRAYSVQVVHFFSEGVERDFQPIIDTCKAIGVECVWHLNSPVVAVHYSLSIADVLVVAKSAFSGSAAFLNQGKVFGDTQLITPRMRKMNIQPMGIQAIWETMGSNYQEAHLRSEGVICRHPSSMGE
jgi:hypothetical protein